MDASNAYTCGLGTFKLVDTTPITSDLEKIASKEGTGLLEVKMYNGIPDRYLVRMVLEGVEEPHEGYGIGSTPKRAAELAFNVALRNFKRDQSAVWKV